MLKTHTPLPQISPFEWRREEKNELYFFLSYNHDQRFGNVGMSVKMWKQAANRSLTGPSSIITAAEVSYNMPLQKR